MKRQPIIVYRVWCGRKCWSAWLPSRDAAFDKALALGLALADDDVTVLGPLTWIEVGERAYARSRTVPLPRGTSLK